MTVVLSLRLLIVIALMYCMKIYVLTDKQIDRQPDRQTDRQTGIVTPMTDQTLLSSTSARNSAMNWTSLWPTHGAVMCSQELPMRMVQQHSEQRRGSTQSTAQKFYQGVQRRGSTQSTAQKFYQGAIFQNAYHLSSSILGLGLGSPEILRQHLKILCRRGWKA